MERKRSLKPSKFNTFFSIDKYLVLYNSLSGAIAAVPSEYAELVKRMLREGISTIGRHKNNDTDIVQMLADGRYLVDALTDEDEMDLDSYISKYNDGSLGLTILPTEQCNFRCVYCYETFERGAMQQEVVLGIKNLIKNAAHSSNCISPGLGGSRCWLKTRSLIYRNMPTKWRVDGRRIFLAQ